MAYGGFLSLSGIRGLKVWMESVGVVLLLGKVSHGNLILFPECVDVVCWAEAKRTAPFHDQGTTSRHERFSLRRKLRSMCSVTHAMKYPAWR